MVAACETSCGWKVGGKDWRSLERLLETAAVAAADASWSVALVALACVGSVGWLGGGRRWEKRRLRRCVGSWMRAQRMSSPAGVDALGVVMALMRRARTVSHFSESWSPITSAICNTFALNNRFSYDCE